MSHELTLLHPPRAANDVRVNLNATSGPLAWPETFKVMQDIWKNEETRFSNLNTRGLGIVTASSVITTLLGFFSKDIFLSSSGQLAGTSRHIAQWTIGLSLVLLVLTAVDVVMFVLMPSGRLVVGNNILTGELVGGSYQPGQSMPGAADVHSTMCTEYGKIYVALAARNARKAYALSWAYFLFAVAMVVATAGTILEVVSAPLK